MVNSRQVVRAIIFASLLSVLSAGSVSPAFGQFTVTVSALTPRTGVDPGGSATANVTLGASPGFTSPVSLSCTVTAGPVTSGPTAPVCTISPTPATPPSVPAMTIQTSDSTPVGTYQLMVTGTSGPINQTATLYLSVADLTEDYSLSVLPTTAIPSPIPAGSTATTTVTVMPIGSYSGNVTLACLSINPIVIAAPYCSFNPNPVMVTGGAGATSMLTITTFGAAAASTKRLSLPRMFYALWLAVPGLALVGAFTGGRRRRRFLGMLFLLAVAAGLLVLPACNTGTIGTTAVNGQVTPNNSYMLTLSAADANGAGPSNIGTGADAATVAITVTKATTAN